MVMHARKPQRVNDGYFEKHPTHPYQNSKYSSKRDYEREANRSTFTRERENSPGEGPIINGNNSYRGDSPDLDSPRENKERERIRERDKERYQNSGYIQKIREKERERENYKKEKYNECLRSPKDKRDRRDRESEHRTNHDRIEFGRRTSKLCGGNQTSTEKRGGSSSNSDERERERERDRDRDRERVVRIGDWSEHVSSSGKKYYYNCKTEVSQWEKPREWLEKERLISKEQHREYRERERERDDRFSSRSAYGKHSSSRGSSRIRWPHETDGPPILRRRHDENQDMDISPGDSTPTSEASYSHSSTPTTTTQNNNDGPVLLATALPRLASHPSTPTNSQLHFTTPTSLNSLNIATASSNASGNSATLQHQSMPKLLKNNDGTTCLPTLSPSTQSSSSSSCLQGAIQSTVTLTGQNDIMSNSNVSSGQGPPSVTLANLPKILSQITGNKTIDQNELNPQKALQTINNALLMSSRQQQAANIELNHNSNSNILRDHNINSPYSLSHLHSISLMNHTSGNQYITGTNNQILTGIKLDGNGTMIINDGPPTPTQDLDLNDHRKLEGTSASLSSLSSQVSRTLGPSLTPSLSNYYRADLIAHVTGWQAEILEKQAQKCSDEAHIIGDLQCTRVSAELKIARSLVRITEITATLQEQKVMYLRQQIRRLEELKSQNSFMSDDL